MNPGHMSKSANLQIFYTEPNACSNLKDLPYSLVGLLGAPDSVLH